MKVLVRHSASPSAPIQFQTPVRAWQEEDFAEAARGAGERWAPERREGGDLWQKALPWLAMACWGLLVVALGFFDAAQPQRIGFFERFFHVFPRAYWDEELARWGIFFFVVTLGLSGGGIALNMKRLHRRTDRIRLSLLLTAVGALFGGLFLLPHAGW